MTHILVFGDSIAWGAWDSEGGWVERLKKVTNEKNEKWSEGLNYWCMIYNQGVSGDSSDNIIIRFEAETKARHYNEEEDIVIFAVGLNDSSFLESKKDNMVPIKIFEENMQKLIDISGKIFSKTVFLGTTPVDEKKTNPIPWAPDMYLKNKSIKQYNNIISKICTEKGVEFIDVFELFYKSDPKHLLKDGVHPNTEGHKLIFKKVRKFLEEKGII